MWMEILSMTHALKKVQIPSWIQCPDVQFGISQQRLMGLTITIRVILDWTLLEDTVLVKMDQH